jgi:SAM-dependent methyltransferase
MLHAAQGRRVKLNAAERWLVNNPARALVQRFYEVPLLRRLGGRVEGGSVLEVGCGRGVGLPLLLSEFGAAHVDGVDLDPRQVTRARMRLRGRYEGRIDVRVASVEQLPFQNASFDAVFDFGILHHIPAWQSAVSEIGRVLKPGGTFFFEEVTSAALERWSYRTFLEHPKANRFSEADFLEALRNYGLRPESKVRRVLFGDIFIGVARRC